MCFINCIHNILIFTAACQADVWKQSTHLLKPNLQRCWLWFLVQFSNYHSQMIFVSICIGKMNRQMNQIPIKFSFNSHKHYYEVSRHKIVNSRLFMSLTDCVWNSQCIKFLQTGEVIQSYLLHFQTLFQFVNNVCSRNNKSQKWPYDKNKNNFSRCHSLFVKAFQNYPPIVL